MFKREIVLFFAGVTAWESFVHLILYLTDSLPFRINGFTIDIFINTIQIVLPAIISFVLLRYANWLRMNRNR
jgi:hypothetical protein